ncbi:unnamed protein product [Dicrocoelium dendriticum]|nr:unnamed protein product [Dicrocoelium dendriticum]
MHRRRSNLKAAAMNSIQLSDRFVWMLYLHPACSFTFHFSSTMQYDELSQQTKALLHRVPNDLANLEHSIAGITSLHQVPEISKAISDVYSNLKHICSNSDRLANLLLTLEPVSRRSQLRLSLDQMRHECKYHLSSLQAIERKQALKQRQLSEREELLAHEFSTNATLRGSSSTTVVKLESDLEHHSRLSAASRHLDGILMSGAASLASLKEQGLTLKGAQRRVLDLINTLGLSNTVMRLIERRTHQDKILFWLLAAVTLFLMYVIWRTIR